MVLLKEGFACDLLRAGDYKKNPMADIDKLLSAFPEDEQKARKEEYLLDLRIMKLQILHLNRCLIVFRQVVYLLTFLRCKKQSFIYSVSRR